MTHCAASLRQQSYFFGHSIANYNFQYQKVTINNSVSFQTLLTKFRTVIDNSLRSCCKIVLHYFLQFFFLNRLRFSYFIIKRVVLQFFSDTRGRWRCSYYNLPFVRIMFTVHVFQAITAEPITAEFHMYTFLTTRTAD